MVSKESRFQGKYLLSEQFKGTAAFWFLSNISFNFTDMLLAYVLRCYLCFNNFESSLHQESHQTSC